MQSVFDTLQVYLGSYYVNNFNEFGRSWQVNVMADPKFRARIEDLKLLKVRNNRGEMVPLGTVLDVRDTSGPVAVMRYNMYSAAAINGNMAPETSSGQAITLMQNIAHKILPPSMAYDWTELTYMQLQAGNTAVFVFALAVVFVFLVLAAQYESWKLPMAVILVVPMCLLCSVVGVAWARLDVNIFTQIGLVVLVGLASKNAILIVEFAKQQQESGVRAPPGRDRSLPPALAADSDDLVRLHPGRGAAGGCRRGRRRNAPHAGPGRLQRHAGRHPVRHLSDARLLRRHPAFRQTAGTDRRHSGGRNACWWRSSSNGRPPGSRRATRADRPAQAASSARRLRRPAATNGLPDCDTCKKAIQFNRSRTAAERRRAPAVEPN